MRTNRIRRNPAIRATGPKVSWWLALLRLVCALTAAAAVGAAVTATSPAASATPCTNGVELVVARGTQEPGDLGTEVGDPLFAALRDTLSMPVTAYRVNYPANLMDPMSVGTGSADLVQHLIDQVAICPAQRFIVAGYSQGAVVVHAALGTGAATLIPGSVRLPPDVGDRIGAVLLFGDPLRLISSTVPDRYLPRTGSWCTDGDPICQPGGSRPPAHIAYSDTISAAAQFSVTVI